MEEIKKKGGRSVGENDLKACISDREEILWEGKPDKRCFILECIFNPLLPFALAWLLFDLFFICNIIGDIEGSEILMILVFFALHLMPVWLYIVGILFPVRRYRNTYYIITDAGVYVSGGTFSYAYQMKPFAEITNISMARGFFDQYLGVGDVIFANSFSTENNKGGGLAIQDIYDYQEVYKMVTELQRDVFSDTMYPNDLRPEGNHGYRTKLFR